MKFGGSCLQSRDGLLRMTAHVAQAQRPVIVVLSALKGVTDQLIGLVDAAAKGTAPDLRPLRLRHDEVLEVLKGEHREIAARGMKPLFDDLERTLVGIASLGEAPERARDRIVGMGERLSVVLAAAALAQAGLPTKVSVGAEAGVVTSDVWSDASLLPEAADRARARFGRGDDVVHVVPGFVGQTPEGHWTTLGRGGSDTTATFLGAALGAPVVLWKDTPGLLTADPRIVDKPRVIDRIHYLDVLELAHYGLQAIAEKAVHPARRAGVPVEIRSFVDEAPPSLVGDVQTTQLAITCVPEVVMLGLLDLGGDASTMDHAAADPMTAAGAARVLGGIARVLDALGEAGVLPLLLTEASPAGEATVAIKAKHRAAVEKALARRRLGIDVQWRDGVAAVSLIGSAMRGRVGFAASVFSCLAKEGINIDVISQTASERNISVIVRRDQAKAAVRALHASFVES
jgi:aspartate kinase